MPFKSQAQRRKFAELLVKGETSQHLSAHCAVPRFIERCHQSVTFVKREVIGCNHCRPYPSSHRPQQSAFTIC